ncbi:MAG: DNA gyrase inhibitor YacG [Nitratireductor sp.]
MSANIEPLRKPRPCPQCAKPSMRDTYPFCSRRCADLDLGRWLDGAYALPASGDGEPFDGDDGN